MSNPLTHVATRRASVIVGAPARATELGMERVLQGRYKIEEPLGVGGSSQQRIEQAGPLKTGDAVRIAIEVANGLAFAHSKGIIHADLKPANILFDANDAAKICDFGIARNPQEDADTPQLYATAMYVAPERVEGKSATVQSDVYGLGLVLYEGLVGKPPFTSTNAAV